MQNLIINIPFNSTDVFYYLSFKVYLLAASKHRLSLQIFICCVYCSPIVPCSQCWRILCSGRTWAFLQVMTSLIGIPNWCWVFRFGGLQKTICVRYDLVLYVPLIRLQQIQYNYQNDIVKNV